MRLDSYGLRLRSSRSARNQRTKSRERPLPAEPARACGGSMAIDRRKTSASSGDRSDRP